MPTLDAFSAHAARVFADKYATASSEKQLAQSFWRDFLIGVCGVGDLLGAGIEFEAPVRSSVTGTVNFVDLLWPGVFLVEHKSAGADLDKAETQARDYLVSLDPMKRPPAIVLSDFARMRIIEVLRGTSVEFPLEDLPENLPRFEAIIGDHAHGATRVEATADRHAAELMARLFVEFERAGYEGHAVSVFLVRVLFLLFGDDTRMWKKGDRGLFQDLIGASPPDGVGLGGVLQELFQVLDTSRENRPATLPPSLSDFPYVNGGLFKETLPVFSFTPAMRHALVEAGDYGWGQISPAIFGSMFQTIKSKEARRELGEHYTSEANILKVIGPLFLNDFNDRLTKAWDSAPALRRFQEELGAYNFLDPACGCGNFLLVAYKRLRELELKLIARLQELEGTQGVVSLDGTLNLRVHLSQFHGIEYEEWSSQIATVAMFLADHQMNLAMEEITGVAPNRFPLTESAKIVHGNALDLDWASVAPMSATTFIIGNPPFHGARWQSASQKEDTRRIWDGVKGVGDLDYVANWFRRSADYIASDDVCAAFVATNSISQGEQPGIVWGQLAPMGIGIDFAHRTFEWANEGTTSASVHCVIIGLSRRPKSGSLPLTYYATPKSAPFEARARNINAYLLDAPNILIAGRSDPLGTNAPRMDNGNMPNDGGFLSLISRAEADAIRASDSIAGQYLRPLLGGHEMIQGDQRFCLWLKDADPSDIRKSPVLTKRVAAVHAKRLASKREATRRLASRPGEFGEIRQPAVPYLAVPIITSERRDYVPIALFDPDVIINNKICFVADDVLAAFGILSSRPFNVWNKGISGRTKNDTVISIRITYNNFPFPALDGAIRATLESIANRVLDARLASPTSTLADLYDPLAMPPLLRAAHAALDKEVLSLFGLKPTSTDEEILAVLFERYAKLTEDLLSEQPPKKGARRK